MVPPFIQDYSDFQHLIFITGFFQKKTNFSGLPELACSPEGFRGYWNSAILISRPNATA